MDLIKSILGDRFDNSNEIINLYGKDYSHCVPILNPVCVIYPINSEEIQQILRICNTNKIPVIGYGKGTSLEGQILTQQQNCVVMSLEKMDKVISIDEVFIYKIGIFKRKFEYFFFDIFSNQQKCKKRMMELLM